mgnify:CR=1 FL=1
MKCIRLDFTALFAYIFAGAPREMKNALPFEGNEKSRRSMRTMKRIANLFGNLRFRDKLTLSTLVASLIPLMLFSVVVGTIVMREVSRKSQQLSLQMVTQTSESLDVYIGTIEKLMDVVIAEGGELPTAQDGQAQNLQKLSRDILQAYPEIAGITIAYPDDSYIGEGMTRISRDRFADEYWYQYAAKQDGQLGIIGSAIGRNVVNNLNESSDSIFSLVKSFETEGGCGVVLFDIRHTIIEKSIERVSIGEEGLLFVADDRDVVYTPVSDVVYRIDRECYENVGGASEKIRIGGKNYFVVNYYSPYSRWRVVGVVPETEFSAGMHSLYQMFFVCVGISILLVAFASVTVSATVTQPVLRLCSSMERAEAGDFSVRFNTKYTDEIGVLGLSFNHMIERINNLINELYVERQVRLEAQLKSLQEQIKPHFLYNTLDTISWLARAHDAMDVVQLVDALTNMFRVGLSSGHDYIPLREEKRHVVNYLYIQGVRYGERLKYEIEIPEAYENIIVPKLILQPLVENAIYHGIKLKRTGGTIRVSSRADEERLYLSVRDNGAGISAERLADIRVWLADPKSRERQVGFGLSYMEERIELSYGSGYGLSIDSREGEFTEVVICLPVQGGERNV